MINKMKYIYLVIFVVLISSCRSNKYSHTEKIYKEKSKKFSKLYNEAPVISQLNNIKYRNKEWIASINYGVRKPNYVMIHHTAQDSLQQTINTFHSEKAGVSSHYIISRDGKIVQMINDLYRAHHAGAGKWGNDTDLNSSSIGIELDNNGTSDYWPEEQINSLIKLLDYLKITYKIPQTNFIGHMDYAPERKNDPSKFPWKKLAQAGFGHWYDEHLETPPNNFDVQLALRIIGYDVKNINAAIKGFKSHYIQKNTDTPELNDEELKILYSIFKKYL